MEDGLLNEKTTSLPHIYEYIKEYESSVDECQRHALMRMLQALLSKG